MRLKTDRKIWKIEDLRASKRRWKDHRKESRWKKRCVSLNDRESITNNKLKY
jgi:hypothetical protein